MNITAIIPQLRTTDLAGSIDFYTRKLGFALEFRYQDSYAGIRAGSQAFHLKQVCSPDPSIADVDEGGHFHLYLQVDDAEAAATTLQAKGVALVQDVHGTNWQTREFVIHDDQGHTLYFGQALPAPHAAA